MKEKDKKTEICLNELSVLKQVKSYLSNIMDSSMDIIIITDNVGNIIRVNKFFTQLLGYKQDEAIGKHISELGPKVNTTYNCTTGNTVHIDEKYFEDRRKMYERFVKEKKTTNWQAYFVTKHDMLIPVEHNMSYFHDDTGNIRLGGGAAAHNATKTKGPLPGDGVSFTANKATFNNRGTAKNGYIYLENQEGDAFAVGTRTTGLILLKKWNPDTGEWE